VGVNSTNPLGQQYVDRMVLARLRRCAWLLVLVLGAGLSSPLLAIAREPVTSVQTHIHDDGSTHSHRLQPGQVADGPADGGSTGPSHHCPGCLTDATCAVSCLGVAVLPTALEWSAFTSGVTWNATTASLRLGVAPSGDPDPPRPVLRS